MKHLLFILGVCIAPLTNAQSVSYSETGKETRATRNSILTDGNGNFTYGVWQTDTSVTWVQVSKDSLFKTAENLGYKQVVKDIIKHAPDSVVSGLPEYVFDNWSSANTAYQSNDIVRYNDTLFRCVQSHSSQPSWTPTAATSLWALISNPNSEFPEWIQPSGAHNAYQLNDKVKYNNKNWISTVNSNVWQPGVYGWNEL